jgi:glycosyltransferase involved in cell wall biosynthesis
MTKPPLLTIIIPTYNWSTVLPYSIGSALRQTFSDFEVLVVGDGCTDDSGSVVRMHGDKRVRWINLPANSGHQSAPNNEGLRQARGEYIAYLGHDDLWFAHHLSCLVAALRAGADLAFGLTEIIGPGGSARVAVPARPRYLPGTWIPPTGVAHRRSVTDCVGGWRDYRELETDPEVDLWNRIHQGGHQFAFVPRLTAIKFSASERPRVYRERPCHEQAEWFARIHNELDLEAVELGKLLAFDQEARAGITPYFLLLRDLLHETTRRMPSKMRGMVRRILARPKGQDMDARRLIKGLERKP